MAISHAWTEITTGQTDADSPLNQILMDAIRGNTYHNFDWIGKDYTPADNHDHDNVNSKSVVLGDGVVTTAKLAPNAVTLAKLYFPASGSWWYSFPSWGSTQFNINAYSHIPRFKSETTTIGFNLAWPAQATFSYRLYAENFEETTGYGYCEWDYHSNSPPPVVWIEYDPDSDEIVQLWKSEPLGFQPIETQPQRNVKMIECERFISQIMKNCSKWKDMSRAQIIGERRFLDLRVSEIKDDEEMQIELKREMKIK